MKRCLFFMLALAIVLLGSFTAPINFIDLSKSGTANCYIVSKSGYYKFHAVKGNSSVSVGSVSSVAVLWESYGTHVKPSVGALIKKVAFNKRYIAFQTADTFKEGNAVIAAKDVNGKILWSWHIWFTDQPQGQEYYNNAGTMMDRNLGATSATPGEVGALGLHYQWGRKDPFLGSSSISLSINAQSTITWPSAVESDSSTGTKAYATANPTTFITRNDKNYDWYYTGDSSTDNTRWTTSDKAKSIYDPCPAGWRVPDGGANGVWSKALGSSSSFDDESLCSSSNEGMNFSGKFGSASSIWYPASGCRYDSIGGLYDVLYYGFSWSASPNSRFAYLLNFSFGGSVNPSFNRNRAYGLSVRCVKEDSLSPAPHQHTHQSDLNVSSATDLSSSGSANCYIVSKSGIYKFKTVKGNSSTSVGNACVAETLWETFGTLTTPSIGDLVSAITYKDGYIAFQTADTFKEGNAVIAAKDANGKILWSWHIWFTDQPQGQEYYNNAGTMMDRNLGATSAIPGDVGALGLLYQWGRKDPFLGSSSISGDVEAKSTITWPSAVVSDSSTGTIAYATANPTTFITRNDKNYDWYYTGDSSTDNTRWTTSDKAKSIYDPCPSGWRVPDGGDNGVWSKALGSSLSFNDESLYSSSNEGMNFSGKYGSASTIWYPASGYRYDSIGGLYYVGKIGRYWSASPDSYYAYYLYFYYNGGVGPSYGSRRPYGLSVRCVKEELLSSAPKEYTHQSDLNISSATDLSSSASANCYIISEAGLYKFKTVKGNSSTSVGNACVAETLWETFGTLTTPSIGDLVSAITYKDGYIAFQTADTFKEGNAVIAAKDVNGKILWSWHIWFTDQPKEQVYYNDAGTMMDRNLGATSATPGDVGARGLLYQWGRKDPFLGSSSISEDVVAKSTITWPSEVKSTSSTGTISYATAHPVTFITSNSSADWYYTGSSTTDNTRWTTSDKAKSIYDPCPSGWRVPDGGDNGVWSKALGSSSEFNYTYDSTNEGMDFSGKFGSASTIWYPASGYRNGGGGRLDDVGYGGCYWSASPDDYYAYFLLFYYGGDVLPSGCSNNACGQSVRCLKEELLSSAPQEYTHQSDLNISSATDLSSSASANCYIISEAGLYKFKTVKGNSSTSVGSVASASILWETFGTSTSPEFCDLISGFCYKDSYIAFQTADTFKEGNAVIAAKDANGNILWSWHIWLTDQPKEQVYYNNAGTMMDRNLGATSATPGEVGALGLLYQWGRKDPFLGSSSISSNTIAKSTITWPSAVVSDSSTGTIAYATANPTTFITYNYKPYENYDWYYTSWTTSKNAKSSYDPCPAGWRVPDGGSNGIWLKALGSSSSYTGTYDSASEGMNFSGKFGSDQTIWYPASGFRYSLDGSLNNVGDGGIYWSASPYYNFVYFLSFSNNGNVYPSDYGYRAYGQSVRCLQESK